MPPADSQFSCTGLGSAHGSPLIMALENKASTALARTLKTLSATEARRRNGRVCATLTPGEHSREVPRSSRRPFPSREEADFQLERGPSPNVSCLTSGPTCAVAA